MSNFTRISPYDLKDNLFTRIGRDWMLVTAQNPTDGTVNTMTASWGGTGILWNKPVAFVFIRPQRYTFGFIEAAETLSLSFFDETYRTALQLCGRVSGREHDKIAEAGLTPITDGTTTSFAEARLILKCRKLYTEFLREDAFLDASLLQNYTQRDFHKMYICEITDVLKA